MSFLRRRLEPAFELEKIAIMPGAMRPCAAEEWLDAIVLIERGEIELDCLSGSRRFVSGDILCLSLVPFCALRNSGREPVLLVAVRRAR